MNLIDSKNGSYIQLNKKYNYGLGLLKVYLALTVIISHCCKRKTVKNKYIFVIFAKSRRIHVPSFFIISFYFIYNNLVNKNFRKLLIRLERLIIPYAGWPIIVYILNNGVIQKITKNNKLYSIKDLKNQLLWGNIFIIQFWFQWDLIMITIMFFILIFVLKNNYFFYLQLLAFFAYFLQYSGYNLKFYKLLRTENKGCLGRIAEIFPFTVTGFYLASLNIFDLLYIHKIKTLIFSSLTFCFLEIYSVFSQIKGIAYSGIDKNIRAISLIFTFSLFPTDQITNKKIKIFLRNISNYTGGIFFLHYTVYMYFKKFIKLIERGTFFGCIIIYLICYLLCLMGAKISGKSKFKYLFL